MDRRIHFARYNTDDMKPALIFDLDGTLWDSTLQVTEAWKIVGQKMFGPSFDLSVDKVRSLMGKTMDEIKNELTPFDADAKSRNSFGDECFLYENEYLSAHPGSLFPRELETLSLLARDYDLYIVSNCQFGYIETFLPLVPNGMFRGYRCFDDTKKAKEFTIRFLVDEFRIQRALYIGDTAKDEKASRAAGVGFVHASYGFGSAESPDATADSFESLPAAIKSAIAHLE